METKWLMCSSAEQSHPEAHLVLKVNTQPAVETEGSQGSGITDSRFPSRRLQKRFQICL